MWPFLLCISHFFNKANVSDLEVPFLDLHISDSNDSIFTKIYDNRDDFNFDIVNFPHLDGDVPKAPSYYGIYISQLLRYTRACSHLQDFNERNLCITKKLLLQGYKCHKLRKICSKFFHRNRDVLFKCNTSLKSLIIEGVDQPYDYGDVIYKLRKIKQHEHFHDRFVETIKKFIKRGYSKEILKHTVCLAIGPCTVDRYAFLFCCTMT
jgi:hypothetical protein